MFKLIGELVFTTLIGELVFITVYNELTILLFYGELIFDSVYCEVIFLLDGEFAIFDIKLIFDFGSISY
jgi:hypothetical protein